MMILIIEAKIVLLGYYLGIRSEEYKTMKKLRLLAAASLLCAAITISAIHPYRAETGWGDICLLYTSPSPRDGLLARMPSSA